MCSNVYSFQKWKKYEFNMKWKWTKNENVVWIQKKQLIVHCFEWTYICSYEYSNEQNEQYVHSYECSNEKWTEKIITLLF